MVEKRILLKSGHPTDTIQWLLALHRVSVSLLPVIPGVEQRHEAGAVILGKRGSHHRHGGVEDEAPGLERAQEEAHGPALQPEADGEEDAEGGGEEEQERGEAVAGAGGGLAPGHSATSWTSQIWLPVAAARAAWRRAELFCRICKGMSAFFGMV